MPDQPHELDQGASSASLSGVSEHDRLEAQRDAIIARKEAPIREAIDHLEYSAEIEEKIGHPCGEGSPILHRRHASALYEMLSPVSRRLMTLAEQHAPDCGWHCEQYPHECTCGASARNAANAARATLSPPLPSPLGVERLREAARISAQAFRTLEEVAVAQHEHDKARNFIRLGNICREALSALPLLEDRHE